MKILFLLLCFISYSALALEVPSLTRPIEDKADLLTEDDQVALEAKIRSAHDEKLVQISVLIIPSLEEEVLEEYSIKVAEKWQLGSSKEDNGLLFLIAMKEKKIRLEVGNGIEHIIPDYLASRMISDMAPYMRQQDYVSAISVVVDQVIEKFKENTPERIAQREEEERLRQKAHEESMAKLKSLFAMGLHLVLFIFGAFGLFKFFSNKEVKELNADNENLSKQIAIEEEYLKQQQNKFNNTNLNQDKYTKYELVQKTSKLEAEKQALEEKIRQMKRKVGEK